MAHGCKGHPGELVYMSLGCPLQPLLIGQFIQEAYEQRASYLLGDLFLRVGA